MQSMHIGPLAAQAEVSVDTIRYYERAHLETRLAELMRLRDGLKQLVDVCPGHGGPTRCPIVNAFRNARDER